jgi:carbonic anhydrase/acetyltransferase-like protein (isoleucine patch superfamily)
MTVKKFKDFNPEIDPSAYVDAMAYVSGMVSIGADSSVWPMAVARGDMNTITIGARTNIQDGAILHGTHSSKFSTPEGYSLTIGDDVTVGHNAILHACTVGNRCLVGMGAVVLDGAVLADEVIVGAGSLVPPNKTLESGLWVGSPAKKVRELNAAEKEFLLYSAKKYAELACETKKDF